MTRAEQYPLFPGFQREGPSREAAESMAEAGPEIRARCLQVLKRSLLWLTSDEIATVVNVNRYTVRARMAELHALGLIRDSGLRRKNVSGRSATVWQPVRE